MIRRSRLQSPGIYKFQMLLAEDGSTQKCAYVGGTASPFDQITNGNLFVGQSGHFGQDSTESVLTCTGDIIAFLGSDMRWKSNIIPITNPIEKVKMIGGYTYNWKDNSKPHNRGKKDVGVLAQEIEKVLPEIVREDKEGYKSVQYDKIIPLLIESIKEQQKQIEELKLSIEIMK